MCDCTIATDQEPRSQEPRVLLGSHVAAVLEENKKKMGTGKLRLPPLGGLFTLTSWECGAKWVVKVCTNLNLL